VLAVDDLSLQLAAGEVVGVLGPNGAGKTTTIKMAATLLEPTSGSVQVAGIDAVKDPRSARRNIGLVLGGDRGFYMRASAQENLSFFAELQGVSKGKTSKVAAVLETVGLSAKGKVRVEEFSRGMKQRLHIARALLADPQLILLDEPSIGLDPEGAQELRALVRQLRQERRAILLTTHYLQEAEELSDRLAVIADGQVVASGSAEDIAAEAGVSTVTSLSVRCDEDPQEVLKRVRDVADVTTLYKNGLWSVDVVWGEAGGNENELHAALGKREIISEHNRRTSLEEAYLAFLHRRRLHREVSYGA